MPTSHSLMRWIALIAIAVLALYAIIVYQTVSLDTYPLFSDEYGYTLNIKNFYKNHILDAAFTLDASYSRYGNFSFHGFSYTLLYGLLATLLHTDNILVINTCLGFLTIGFLFFLPSLKWEQKSILTGVLVTYFVFFIFNLSFMVESIHFLGAVLITYLLYKLFDTGQKSYMLLFLITVLLFASLRQTWIFFLTALFFLPNIDKKRFFIYLCTWILAFSLVFIDISFFHAHYPNSFLAHLFEQTTVSHMFEFWLSHVQSNLVLYFSKSHPFFYYMTKIVFILLILYTFLQGLLNQNRFLLALSAVAFVYFTALIFLYDAQAWREHRVLAVVYISLVLGLALTQHNKILIILFLFQLLAFPQIISYFKESRMVFYTSTYKNTYKTNNDLLSTLQKLPNRYTSPITVSFDQNTLPLNYNHLLSQLPVRTSKGTPIRYNIYYFTSFTNQAGFGDYLVSRKHYNDLNVLTHFSKYTLYRLKGHKE